MGSRVGGFSDYLYPSSRGHKLYTFGKKRPEGLCWSIFIIFLQAYIAQEVKVDFLKQNIIFNSILSIDNLKFKLLMEVEQQLPK